MAVEIRQLKDKGTGTPFVPLTHWDAVSNKPSIPSKTSDLTNDSGFLTTETDPTVPSWAKLPNKPSYTASEVGALPDNTTIPSKTSDLTNDSGFLTSHQELKTINNQSLIGTGNITISGGSGSDPTITVNECLDVLNRVNNTANASFNISFN